MNLLTANISSFHWVAFFAIHTSCYYSSGYRSSQKMKMESPIALFIYVLHYVSMFSEDICVEMGFGHTHHVLEIRKYLLTT